MLIIIYTKTNTWGMNIKKSFHFSNFTHCVSYYGCGTTSSYRILSESRHSLIFVWKWTNVYKESQIKLMMIPNLCHFITKCVLCCKSLNRVLFSQYWLFYFMNDFILFKSCLFSWLYFFKIIFIFSITVAIQY